MKNKPDFTKYIENEGVTCPYCGTQTIETDGHFTMNCNQVFQNVACQKCEEEWVDIYTLTSAEPGE